MSILNANLYTLGNILVGSGENPQSATWVTVHLPLHPLPPLYSRAEMGFTVGGIERCGILGPHKVKEGKQLFLVDFYSTLPFLSTFAGTDLSFLWWGIDGSVFHSLQPYGSSTQQELSEYLVSGWVNGPIGCSQWSHERGRMVPLVLVTNEQTEVHKNWPYD